MNKKIIITAVLFFALACAIAFTAYSVKFSDVLYGSKDAEVTEEAETPAPNILVNFEPEEDILAEEENLLAFEESILAYEESLLAYEESMLAYEESILAYEESILAYEESLKELEETEPETTVDQLPEPDPQKFSSSLFIGDSRTVGIDYYGDIDNATFFATKGMNVYRVFKEQLEVEGLGKVSIFDVLQLKNYDKIYLMLGLNEVGYDTEAVISKYSYLIEKIREAQPEAVIYLQANLHITTSRSDVDEVFNNTRLNILNSEMAALANGEDIVYLDANPIFDDEKGGLGKEYASDDFHLKSDYYPMWVKWIAYNSI
ncbi:MAG: acylhydrolase [Clostridia bacterium]|nr:acylhydrolase [Clostridia bacterium]